MTRRDSRPFLHLLIAVGVTVMSIAVGRPAAQTGQERFIVIAKTDADYPALLAAAVNGNGRIIKELRAVRSVVVRGSAALKASLKLDARAQGVVEDKVMKLIEPQGKSELFNASGERERFSVRVDAGISAAFTPDPAFDFPAIMWSINRVRAPQAWPTETGSSAVKVGVADTGLDYTHAELAGQVVSVVDLTVSEDPPLCSFFFGVSDQDLASFYGGPADGDWNGHGTWIGGNIAGVVDGAGINGIAPGVKLVALKIAQWCGFAFTSTIIDAFVYAADHGIDIVNISFGGYRDFRNPDERELYGLEALAAAYARARGTVIVASAGNDHVRIGTGGIVLSRGSLTLPGSPVVDLLGQFQTPGGLPGVVNVSATGNVVNAASPSCTPASSNNSNATCKPASDTHQPIGVGREDQLAYYSNYGPRIDVAAPGGARKFNLPNADRGGTPGFPYNDGLRSWESFSITSNWATQIPCFLLTGGGFHPNECYTSIQGTSMSAPHAAGVLALIASEGRGLRRDPTGLVNVLKASTRQVAGGNRTPPLSGSDTTAGDLTGILCPTGYCHLGGAAISNAEAYGAGIVNAQAALQRLQR